MTDEQKGILENLRKAIFEYDAALAKESSQQAVEKGIDPVEALNAMTVAIREIGDAFGKGELWLPDLVGASDAMQAATPVLEEEMERRGAHRESLGTVVAGTVFGDIHSIGKTMVTTLLTAAGFHVEDLGVNVKAEAFIEKIRQQGADLLAMSALMTTTMTEQERVIQALKKEGFREKVKVMVGGAAVSDEFAEDIGADGYEPTAPGAVALAKNLLGKGD
jgi:corrinoid protein of di/trimethylamine methyltransferase